MKKHILLKSVCTNFKERQNKSLLEARRVTLGNKVRALQGSFWRCDWYSTCWPRWGLQSMLTDVFTLFCIYIILQNTEGLSFFFGCFFLMVKGRKQTLSWIYELKLSQSLSWELTQIPIRSRQEHGGELSQGTEEQGHCRCLLQSNFTGTTQEAVR